MYVMKTLKDSVYRILEKQITITPHADVSTTEQKRQLDWAWHLRLLNNLLISFALREKFFKDRYS